MGNLRKLSQATQLSQGAVQGLIIYSHPKTSFADLFEIYQNFDLLCRYRSILYITALKGVGTARRRRKELCEPRLDLLCSAESSALLCSLGFAVTCDCLLVFRVTFVVSRVACCHEHTSVSYCALGKRNPVCLSGVAVAGLGRTGTGLILLENNVSRAGKKW